jgi:lysophospholipase L1-like esterase
MNNWQHRVKFDRLRRPLSALAAVMLLAALAGVEARPAEAAANSGTPCPPVAGQPTGGSPSIMVVGDSISQGSAGDFTWRYRLYENFVADGLHPQMVGPYNWLFDNVSSTQGSCAYADPVFENAHDATWGQTMGYEVGTIQSEAAASQPRYMLVLLGINDLAFGLSSVSGLESNLQQFVANARTGDPNVQIVIGDLLPKANEAASLSAEVAQYNSDLPGLATQMSTAQSRVVIADDASAINPATDLWDGTHPNAQGDMKIAAGFAAALSSDFGLGSPFPTPLPAVPTGPQTPPQLSLTPGNGTIKLSWTGSPGATGYVVFVNNLSSGSGWGQLPYPLTLADSPWTGGFEPGATYQVKLQADKGSADGVFSNVATATVTGVTPTGATNLSAAAGNGQAVLSWTADPNATGYYVYVQNDSAGQTSFQKLPYPVTGTTWTAGLLTNGSTYEFKLQSTDGLLAGGYSNTVTVTPTGPTPAAVTDLSVTGGDGQAVLSWTAVANATGYYVLMENVTAGDTSFTKLPYPVQAPSWTAGDLINGVTYEFEVQSADGSILGPVSNTVTVTPTTSPPPAPTNLAIAAGNGQATLSWTAAPDATCYYVLQKDDSAGDTTFTQLPYAVSGTSWTASGLVNGATYEYELRSVSGQILGGTTSAVSVTPTGPAPAAPTLTITAGNGQAALLWNAVTAATGYYVWMRDVTHGGSFTQLPDEVSGTTWTASLLENGATYQFEIQPYDGLVAGAKSAPVSVTPTGPAPAAPTVTATPGNGAATLSWNLVSNATTYYVWERDATQNGTFQKLPDGVAGPTWTAGLLVNGDTYQYEIQPYDGLIAGAKSAAVSVTPTGPAPVAPTLSITSGNGQATLSWNLVANATTYYVWMSTAGGPFTKLPYGVSGPSWTAGALENGQAYQFEIQPYNGAEPGITSQPATANPTGPVPAAPSLSATSGENNQSTLSWNLVANATTYYVWMRDVSASEKFHRLPDGVSGPTWTAGLLENGATYQFEIQPYNGLQAGPRSLPATATPGKAPTQKSFISGAPDQLNNNDEYLTWSAVPHATGYLIVEHDYRNGTVTTLPYPVTGTSFKPGYLATGTYYSWQVQPINGLFKGPKSNTVDIRTTGYAAPTIYELGDSYSSGEGAGGNSYSGQAGCFQSGLAYGYQYPLANWGVIMAACSQYTSTDVQNNEFSSLPPAAHSGGNLIAFTAGGDDIGFAKILAYCMANSQSACTALESQVDGNGLPAMTLSVLGSSVYTWGKTPGIASDQLTLQAFYQHLRERAPGSDIIALGYPLEFAQKSLRSCATFTNQLLGDNDFDMFRRLAQNLDNMMAASTGQWVTPGIQETLNSFSGYEACSVNGEAINELSITEENPIFAESVHPNAKGYQLYAQALAAAEENLAAYGDVVYL